MPERDGYIPGVPCWVDTSQPDPEAAADFYGGLFGWEFEDVMPPGVGGQVLHRAASAAATSPRSASLPEGAPPTATWNTYIWVDSADETAAKVRDAGGSVADGAVRRHGRRPDGGVRRSRGRGVLRLAGEAAQGRAGRQRARRAELQRPQHPRRRGREGVLRRRVRLGDAGAGRRRRDVDAARLRRPPRAATTPACASGWPRSAARRASRTSSRASTRSRTTSPTSPAHWSVTFAVDDADATAAKATELGGKVIVAAVRRPVGADDGARRPAGRDVHRQQVRPGEQRPRPRAGRRRPGCLDVGHRAWGPRPVGAGRAARDEARALRPPVPRSRSGSARCACAVEGCAHAPLPTPSGVNAIAEPGRRSTTCGTPTSAWRRGVEVGLRASFPPLAPVSWPSRSAPPHRA